MLDPLGNDIFDIFTYALKVCIYIYVSEPDYLQTLFLQKISTRFIIEHTAIIIMLRTIYLYYKFRL